jgi:D-threo-aldose 1-dehydrogenase
MIRLKEEGVTKQLGIGGNLNAFFSHFVNSKTFSVFMGYNRFNAVCQDAAVEEYKLMQQQKISIWQASPLYNGLLGRHFENYQNTHPDWIPSPHLSRAKKLFEYCEITDCTMPEIALRYVQSNLLIDKVVIGAVNQQEFTNSLNFWNKGSLTSDQLQIIHNLH